MLPGCVELVLDLAACAVNTMPHASASRSRHGRGYFHQSAPHDLSLTTYVRLTHVTLLLSCVVSCPGFGMFKNTFTPLSMLPNRYRAVSNAVPQPTMPHVSTPTPQQSCRTCSRASSTSLDRRTWTSSRRSRALSRGAKRARGMTTTMCPTWWRTSRRPPTNSTTTSTSEPISIYRTKTTAVAILLECCPVESGVREEGGGEGRGERG